MSTLQVETRGIADSLVDALSRLTGHEDDKATVETFCAIALRVIAATNPSKVREAARLVAIQSLIQPGEPK